YTPDRSSAASDCIRDSNTVHMVWFVLALEICTLAVIAVSNSTLDERRTWYIFFKHTPHSISFSCSLIGLKNTRMRMGVGSKERRMNTAST
ncbi:MAG: hypothetical protein MPL62_17100, partial [Alphaproteobacteria bacterium]|nr:hypothetical protein [Alphaproteobacteria bacterium]